MCPLGLSATNNLIFEKRDMRILHIRYAILIVRACENAKYIFILSWSFLVDFIARVQTHA